MAIGALERRAATWEQYQSLGEDARAEYIDGEIIMTPPPSIRHQKASRRLANLLESVLPDGFDVVEACGWKPGDDEFIPDVMVFPETDEDIRFTGTPVLCVEVISGNRANDYLVKTTKYAQAGLDHYWIVDPADDAVQILGRDGEHYVLERVVTAGKPAIVSFGIAEVEIDVAAVLA